MGGGSRPWAWLGRSPSASSCTRCAARGSESADFSREDWVDGRFRLGSWAGGDALRVKLGEAQ
eukprot:468031-Prorocentrum_minimum.AAC.1